jgi:hypothetical protein
MVILRAITCLLSARIGLTTWVNLASGLCG